MFALCMRRLNAKPLSAVRFQPQMLKFCSTTTVPPVDAEAQMRAEELEYEQEIKDILQMYSDRDKRRQCLIGKVMSTKCSKSITVKTHNKYFHAKYGVFKRSMKKVMAHDENEECNPGDIVRIVPCRPRSAKKRHMLMDIIRRQPQLGFDEHTILAAEKERKQAEREAKRKEKEQQQG